MGDTRRTRRAVALAGALVAEPSAAAQAELRSAWSRLRWRIADDPPCLKTGWRLAARQVQRQDALSACWGCWDRVLAVRPIARQTPPALAQTQQTWYRWWPTGLDLSAMWGDGRSTGGLSGDGPPGGKPLWAGWRQVQAVVEGVLLAPFLLSSVSG